MFANRHNVLSPSPATGADKVTLTRSMRKWYNFIVARATGWPHRSGTGNGEAASRRFEEDKIFHIPAAHPAIAQTALHNSKHNVLGKYWSYFNERNDMFAGRASFGAPSRTRVFLSGLTRASLEYMGRECAPLSCSQGGLGSWSAHARWRR